MENLDPKNYSDKQIALNMIKDSMGLISFDTRVTNIKSPTDILIETTNKILKLYSFSSISFFMINEKDSSFYLAYCRPENSKDYFEKEYIELVDSGLFSISLANTQAQFTLSSDGNSFLIIHPIATPRRIRGVFLAQSEVSKERFPEYVLYMLTIILFSCASLIESYETYNYLSNINKKLKEKLEELEILNKKLSHEIYLRQEKELELKRSEEKYRSIIENIDDAYVEVDINGKITFFNKSLLKITGYKKEEILGRHFSELTYKKHAKEILNDVKKLFTNRKVGKYHSWKFSKKDGQIIWVESLISPIEDRSDKIVGFRTILRDVTERIEYEKKLIESEKRYKTIFENSGTATIIVDIDGIIVMANREVEKLFGYKKKEIEGKRSIKDFVYPDDLEYVWEYHIKKRDKNKNVPQKIRCRALDAKGNIRQLIVSTELIPGTTDTVVSIIDLTEQEELESQLRQARKFEALGTLAGGIAHEFNNILQGIKSNIELLNLKHGEVFKKDKLLSKTEDLIYRAEVIVNRLLTFSRKTDIKMEDIDLNLVIKESKELLRGAIKKGIEIRTCYCNRPVMILGDKIQLEEIIVNLVNNAVDAIGNKQRGLIEIGVDCIESTAPNHHINVEGDNLAFLWVRDNGCGIKQDKLEKIFTPFYTTKEPGKGTGLGLSIVYGIVKSHKGEILCESQVGVGTTFKIYLPLSESLHNYETKRSKKELNVDKINGSVLVVDDEEIIRDVIFDALTIKGLDVHMAKSSEEAIGFLKDKNKVDLILMDLDMPGMGGVLGVKAILKKYPNLKIIICSGYGKDILDKDPKDIGAVDFLKKPFSLQTLYDIVVKHLTISKQKED